MSLRDPETLGDDMCYTAHKRCGCVVGVVVDKPEYAADVQRAVSQWRLRNLTVRRGRVSDVWQEKTRGWHCPHEMQSEVWA